MTKERRERIRRLFADALKLPSSERSAFLIRTCGSDQDLLTQVESLLSESNITKTANSYEPGIAGPMLSPGTQLGPYEILAHLGSGGMGTVYQALDTRLDRMVAVKLMLPHFADHPEFLRRFKREARAISGLSHPHICTLYDVGYQNGLSYLVMEYLDGKTLGHQLRKGRLEFDEVLRYAIQIASALNEAHNRGIVHRDIKPGNVMLTIWGTKLMDFGLATTFDPPEDNLAPSNTQVRPAWSRLADGKLSLSRLKRIGSE
jgi:serine/threonine protein kinase